jgi:MFS family permease
MAALMPVAGKIYDRFGPRWPALVGLAIAAWGIYLLTGINVDMTRQEVVLWTVVMSFGNGLAIMPIMTAGLNSLPIEYVGFGSAINNITQRISSAIGLAGTGALVVNESAQQTADQGALLQGGDLSPSAQRLVQQGPTGLYELYTQLQLHVQAIAYADVFLLAAALTAACLLLAATLRKPAVATTPAPTGARTTAPAPSAPAPSAPAPSAPAPAVPAPAVPAPAVPAAERVTVRARAAHPTPTRRDQLAVPQGGRS